MKKVKYLLVDGHALLYRGHYAMMRRPLRARDGTNTSGLFYLVREVMDRLESGSPDVVAAVMDYPAPVFRNAIYPEYKANRPPMPDELRIQAKLARELIPALGFPLLEKEGFEADDIIAHLSQKASSRGCEVEILSSDKDLLQLAGRRVTVIRPGKSGGSDRVVTESEVPGEIGVAADQVADYLALTGDSSDNIPGARGIGPKTARKLIEEYGSLDNIYSSLDSISSSSVRKKLQENMDAVRMSRELVSLNPARDVGIELDSLKMRDPDSDRAFQLLTRLGMNSIIKRMNLDPQGDLFSDAEPELPERLCSTAIVNNLEELKRLEMEKPAGGKLAFDTETTSRRPFMADPVGISFAASEERAFYVPLRGGDGVSPGEAAPVLRSILESHRLVAQNGKYDIHILEGMGIQGIDIHGDPMVADYLLRPEVRSHSLSNLAAKYLSLKMQSYDEVLGNAETLADVETEKVAAYCGCDSAAALKLSGILEDELKKDKDLLRIYREVEIPLVRVIADMERRGIGLNTVSLAELESEFLGEIENLERSASKTAEYDINLNSPSQVSEILFQKLGLPPVRKTSTGANSSSMEVLEKLRDEHPFVETVIRHRELSKLLNTYVRKLPEYVCERDGLIHTSFSQTVTATGRLSSSSPNLQNIPIRTEKGRMIRKCIVPSVTGNVFVTADYSQIELRVLAHFAGPGNLRKAYEENQDIHSATARAVFGDSSSENRRKAKEVNFSILYGISPWGLSNRINISRGEASGIISRYLETYPELKTFFRSCVEKAEEKEETRTVLGRKRSFSGMKKAKGASRSSMERMAVNTTIQGSAADIIKLAMLRVHGRLSRMENCGMVLQVHDELVAESPPERAEEVAKILTEEMESAFNLEVPLRVETGIGSDWLEAGH